MSDTPTWFVIEHDQNRGLERIFDIVTKDHAEDLHVGDEVMVVCLEHEMRPGSTPEIQIPTLDFGYGFFAVITEMRALDSGETLVRARPGRQPWWRGRHRRRIWRRRQ